MARELPSVASLASGPQIRMRQLAGIPVVNRAMTTLWTCGRGRP
jgi:hypothetical protein